MRISKELRLGIFVIIVLAATFVVINFLRGTDILGREKEYRGYFYDVETLVPSSPVLIRGYNAGEVSEVSYDPQNDRFEVVCAVRKEFKIPTDSKMMLYSTSIMGGKGIRILPGVSEDAASDGAVLETGSEADLLSLLGSQLAPMLAKVSSLMDSLGTTVSSVNAVLDEDNRRSVRSTLKHLESTVRNAEQLAADLDGRTEGLDEIVANLKTISAALVPVMDSVGVTVGNINSITGELAGAGLESTVHKTDRAIENLDSLMLKVRGPLEQILKDTDDLVNAIKENPKKYMKISVF